MAVETLIDKVTEFFSWLYYRQWARWELMAVAITALVLLLLAGGARRRARANLKRLRERSPIVGINLAQRRARH
jgi:hypothetical protein